MPPGRRNCGNRNTRPTTDLAPWTLTLHPLPAQPRTRAKLANNSQEVQLPTTHRPRIRPRLSPLPPSTNTNRAMDIPTLLRHNIPHSPKLAPTGTPRFLRLPCPRPMVRIPVPLSTGETTKPPGVIPLPDRTGCLKPCLMYLPPPPGLTMPPQQALLSLGQSQTHTPLTHRQRILPPRATQPMLSTAAVRTLLQQQPNLPRLRLMF
jgi:hypothetical protein